MNTAKIQALKQAAAAAQIVYSAEQGRLTELGFKSQARYAALKPLRAVADAAHTAYAKFANNEIKTELDIIIEADRPAREAAARARSPWKQAKFNAAEKV